MRRLFEDKQIMNPLNPEEVFTCADLAEDYKICRKEKRLQTAKIGKKQSCYEFRTMANKCFYLEEDEFVDLILDKYEERKRYADFLESEGSIMAKAMRERQNMFRVRNTGESEE